MSAVNLGNFLGRNVCRIVQMLGIEVEGSLQSVFTEDFGQTDIVALSVVVAQGNTVRRTAGKQIVIDRIHSKGFLSCITEWIKYSIAHKYERPVNIAKEIDKQGKILYNQYI